VAFQGGYHGDTTGAMAISDPQSGFQGTLAGLLPRQIIVDLPLDEASTAALDALLTEQGDHIAAIIVEPLVQGAGGMRLHDARVLQTLRALADRHELLLIFDEIFTGFGRTGTMFAFEQAGVAPDIITLSKALTGGTLPLAATVARRKVFDAFWSDDPENALMHGPTFMANALACAAANASLDLFAPKSKACCAKPSSRAGNSRGSKMCGSRAPSAWSSSTASKISTVCANALLMKAFLSARLARSSI
jgi:adenosylmethionine-8-amino-7-oxononanoate aminotransferase